MPQLDVFLRVVEEWNARSVPLLPPAPDAEILNVFGELDYRLSNDVRRLYSVAGGFHDNGMDRLWSWWSLDHIREQNKHRRPSFVWFADYFISSHLYCFHYENPDVSSVYIDDCETSKSHPPRLIAASVSEFLQKYLTSPDEVEAWDVGM